VDFEVRSDDLIPDAVLAAIAVEHHATW